MLVAPGEGRKKRSQAWEEGQSFALRHQSKVQHQLRITALSAVFWHCTGNIRQPILVCSSSAAPLLQGEHAVNVNAEHKVPPHPWLPAIHTPNRASWEYSEGPEQMQWKQPPSDDTFSHGFVFRP